MNRFVANKMMAVVVLSQEEPDTASTDMSDYELQVRRGGCTGHGCSDIAIVHMHATHIASGCHTALGADQG